jgi:large subunit ribosomal protein L17
MRHLKAGRRLGRNAAHRLAMFRNMAMALFRHERIVTTVAKAKEARPFIEKLITLAKKGTLHARREVLSRLGTPSKAEVRPPEGKDTEGDPTHVIVKLFTDIAPRYADRQGGYLRVLKRHQRRLGDAGETAFLELVKEGERRARKKAAPAPAPVVRPPAPVPTHAPEPTAQTPAEGGTEPTPPPPAEGQTPPTP